LLYKLVLFSLFDIKEKKNSQGKENRNKLYKV